MLVLAVNSCFGAYPTYNSMTQIVANQKHPLPASLFQTNTFMKKMQPDSDLRLLRWPLQTLDFNRTENLRNELQHIKLCRDHLFETD